MDEFYQTPPHLANQYDDDRILQAYLKQTLSPALFAEISPALQRLGERAVSDIYQLGLAAEALPPKHVPYDAWGKRIDRIDVSPAWEALGKIAAEEQLIALGYERKYGEFSRLYQFAKLYLYHPSSAIYTCPLAMADGAARAIELYGDVHLKNHAFKHLISADPAYAWTSGQWMTERTGGSDVSGTSTIAKPSGEQYRLYGTKWFTSATTSQMAMALAKIKGDNELSLFYIELRDQDGNLNHIQINRLKDKLGTRALPTAELTLDGTFATLVGGKGAGVKKIASLFNITRIYNACSAVGYMRRALALACDYAKKRKAFGRFLSQHGLHVETLAHMQVEFEACFHLVFHAVLLLGKDETGKATPNESATLRLLTPLIKLYTAKKAVAMISEAIEAFGGAGYIEDTGLPRLLRDAQVLPIWEGTTNVLSLDALRAIHKEKTAVPFLQDIHERLHAVSAKALSSSKEKALIALKKLEDYLKMLAAQDEETQRAAARVLAFNLTNVYAASLLLAQANWGLQQGDSAASIAVERWCEKELVVWFEPSGAYQAASSLLLGFE